MRVRVIANPVAGGGRGAERAEALGAALRERGADVDLVLTERPGHCHEAASEWEGGRLAVVGGDGTLNEAVNGLRDLASSVAILPTGSANVVARELAVPRDPAAVADLIVQDSTRVIDTGLAEGKRFLLGAGAGLDAAIVEAVNRRRGSRSSVWRWVWPTVHTAVRYPFPKIRVTVDGDVVSEEGQYVIVGNCRYSAGVFPATPRADMSDGSLDVAIIRNLSWHKLPLLAVTVWRPKYLNHPDIQHLKAKRVELKPVDGAAVPLQIDGDPAGHIPATFTVEHEAVRMVAPPNDGRSS